MKQSLIRMLRYICGREIEKCINVYYDYYARKMSKIDVSVKLVGKAKLTPQTCIQEGSVINDMNIIGNGGVQIGRYCHIAKNCTIITVNHNYKGNGIPYDEFDIVKPVKINDFVWIGANVTILPGVEIGKGAILQAGAIIRENVPAYAIVGMQTARIIGGRDVEKFLKLESEGRYY